MSNTSFIQALEIGTNLSCAKSIQRKNIAESVNLILAEDIVATRPLPAFDNSAMDGYAIKVSDYGNICTIKGNILAGDDASQCAIANKETYKVMTGAPLPCGADTVIQVEHTMLLDDSKVAIPSENIIETNVKKGQNIRFKGEEIALGEVLLQKGTKLTHLDVSIIASQGISKINTYAPLHIGIYSSGDEVIEPKDKAAPHQIYNTNATSILALLQNTYKCEYLGILYDNKPSLNEAIASFNRFDVIITSGGASVGDADLIKIALKESGANFLFDGLNVKPGRHLALAMLGKTLVILLPGNPLALLLHLHTLILSILQSFQGSKHYYPRCIVARLSEALTLNPKVTSILLGKLESGIFTPHNHGKIGSSALTNMWHNNALLIAQNCAFISKGKAVKVILYNADFCDIIDFFNT